MKPRQHDSTELDRFKREIPLADYLAVEWGYYLDRRKSTSAWLVMRNDNSGDKLLVGTGNDGHHLFFSLSDPQFKGSIIDFCLERLGPGTTLGHVRKELRPLLAGFSPPAPLPQPKPVEKNIMQVQAQYLSYDRIPAQHPYLTEQRGIRSALLADYRFANIRQDERGNAIFPHYDAAGDVCGYEIAGPAFKQFSSGGSKGLYLSEAGDDVTTIAIGESTVDALSYFALQGHDRMQVASVCGNFNQQQPDIIRRAIKNLHEPRAVIAIFDHDEAGDRLASQLEALCLSKGTPEIAFRVHQPPHPGSDWNDALRASMGSKKKTAQPRPEP